ncbi:CoA-disulfide reductase [Mesobacillus selenatarsenatis]|uniref:CoA-disulfide reductase /disulfide bond regulator n=1 Tax=Mesobacillus selenatarsenatis (strain DSM 18680 / JCM 14380 / FERM P-15431 / SF-1) TaxID=1321606 RepID=A0A0A8WWG8_MESS1|nr:CoA-disulfide reductase [Mesobacillus selenatarsenatis]GAM11980.1 CoA-disulfide reductase /disulfide bond regulator [Mesobacillus selenatarsenatis SF-1]
MAKKVVIVGGVAGGATTAARLRRLDEQTEIVMIERGEYISFANCGLPYYIGGAIQERDALLVQTVEGMSKKFNMDIRNLSEVNRIDRERKVVEIKNLKTGETYEESYDVLVLSPGASPIKPPIPGISEAEALFTLRNIPDTDKIKAYVDKQQPKKATVIGGGFIGVEMAENLWERGVEVTLVEMADQIMAPIDFEMASILHQHLREKGVNLVLEDGVKSFEKNGKLINLNSGKQIDTDLVILAIGVAPENKLAKESGLELGLRGAIRVNERLQTADQSIYAIGDAIEVKDYINGQATHIPLAWPANRQGRIVADHINGIDSKYQGTLGTSIAKVFDMTVAATGNNEKTLKRLGISYDVVHVHPSSHAGYYPGAFPIALKLIFDRETGKIFGAQAVSYDGADKRIDVLATAIKGGMTIFDLPDLELAYAPPYSSAKDPVNMAGYAAKNLAEGLVETVQWHEINDILTGGGYLIDVREPIERDMGMIEGSVNIPLGELRDRLDEIPTKEVYVYCQVGLRGYLATRILMQAGFKVKNLDGGYKTYSCVYEPDASENCGTPISDNGVAQRNAAMEEIAAGAAQTSVGLAVEAAPVAQAPVTPIAPPTVKTTLDACGLSCPGPIMKVYKTIGDMQDGEVMEVHATDPGFAKDIKAWCEKTGNKLISNKFEDKKFKAQIMKGNVVVPLNTMAAPVEVPTGVPTAAPAKNGATMVVFSGDLDKAIATFIIASGAAAMGKEVTLFFTFWGLNILKRNDAPSTEKDMMAKMFSMMMPKGANDLPLSKMNMGGMGSKMIKTVMANKNVDSLETLMKNAMDAGVKLVACGMSMDIMGIAKEELIDGVEIGGVAAYLGDAEDSGLNLFI